MASATGGTGRFRWLPAEIESAASARGYLLNVANGACTKLAEQLASPGLVLPWLFGAIGAPAGCVALLVPARQAGSLLPQLAVAGAIRRLPRRKWAWVAAGGVQSALLLAMIPAATLLSPAAAGWALVVLLLLFSVASGCGSVAFQDVAGSTVPAGARGRMLAGRAAVGGALTLAAGVWMRLSLGDTGAPIPLLTLIAAAALLWAVAAVLFGAIPEPASAPGAARDPVTEWRNGVAAMRRYPGFRRFIAARALLLAVEVAMPFYALHAYSLMDGGLADLGYFVLAVGLAGVVASPFWGRLADGSARRVMMLSAVLGAAAAGLALGLPHLFDGDALGWAYGAVFLVLGIALSGVRLGRKTYLVDGAPSEERPLFAAFSNTLVGGLSLAAGALGMLVEGGGIDAAIGVLGGVAAVAALASAAVPEAERMTALR